MRGLLRFPQDAYGLEKLATEELCKHYNKDFGIECRIGRFHNIYGPFGTWKGGREKAPAAFCRKAITSTDRFEMWGDGLQTRSFTFIDECVEAQSVDSSPVFVQQVTVIAVVIAAASIVVIIKGRGCALSSDPSSLFAGPRGEYGFWTAFSALLILIFFFFPSEMKLPFIALMTVIVFPYQVSNLSLTAVTSHLEKDEVDPKQIGRLEVGILSKSIVLFTFSST
nr:GDP-mannose 3,5-epimerase-like [Ipomoea batatas]